MKELLDYEAIIMVGLPRSGKTTICAGWDSHVRVCPDDIRLALHGQRFNRLSEPFVWAVAEVMARALLIGQRKIVIDATNTTAKRRKQWVALVDEFKDCGVTHCFCLVDTPLSVCLERADDALKPIVNRMAEQYEPVDPQEGHIFTYVKHNE